MIGEKIRKAMNAQIAYEVESFYLYLSMAAYFHGLNLDGMAHWLRCQAHEEMIHAMKFFDHITDRGGAVELTGIRQIKTAWNAPLEAWKDAHEHEKFITGLINSLMKIAREENDYNAEPLLAWFADEQIEEEASTDKVAKQIEITRGSGEGILLLDRELATRVFPPGSSLDRAAYQAAQ